MSIKESGEMYLETILIISKKKNNVRAIDVVKNMGVSKPAVSKALSRYKEEDMLKIDPMGNIFLTDMGLSIAEKIYNRHVMLTSFLMRLGVDEKTASADACKIEHVISDKSFEALKRHNEKYNKCIPECD